MYLPPLFIVSVLGVLAALVTVTFLNRSRLSQFFYYPPLIFVALTIIYVGLIGTLFIPV
ncbi:MAG: DUF1656 domain-containing protein [Nitrospira sp.]|nr:DUF1656 domain-containing protein [Nitrospira sp.]